MPTMPIVPPPLPPHCSDCGAQYWQPHRQDCQLALACQANIGVPLSLPPHCSDCGAQISRVLLESSEKSIGPPLILPSGITWVDQKQDEPIRAITGDSDGPLVPLPAKPDPVRVPPPFPLTAYQALLR